MPLGSVEEWRARIGSSWCAIGRPMKRGKSTVRCGIRPMSGQTMLRALYILMIVALCLFALGTRKCGKTVLDGSEVCMKFSGVSVLKALLISTQVLSFVQRSLLLRCGDIESNPGPESDVNFNNVDSSTILTENDLHDVFAKVHTCRARGRQLGLMLGLPASDLAAIGTAHHDNLDRVLEEVLLAWLRQSYDVATHGPPTWRRLVEAVDNPAGGSNHSLAERIAIDKPIVHIVDESSTLAEAPPPPQVATPTSTSHPKLHRVSRQIQTESLTSPSDTKELSLPESTAFQLAKSKDLEFNESRCRNTLAAYYLTTIDERAWPPVKPTNFIRLALIRNNTSWRETPRGSIDDIVGDKQGISYEEAISGGSRYILFEGRPGSGKTFLLDRIGRDWAKKKVLSNKLLLLIPLRRVNIGRDRSLGTLINVACPGLSRDDTRQLVSYIKERDGRDVVFAFDGFDEYKPLDDVNIMQFFIRFVMVSVLTIGIVTVLMAAMGQALYVTDIAVFYAVIVTVVLVLILGEVCQPKEIDRLFSDIQKTPFIYYDKVINILEMRSLINATCIVTSRPAACVDIRDYADKRIEVVGFREHQVVEYVHHYFANDKKKACCVETHLKSHPSLMHMAYLPLHCAMLVFLYEDGIPLPETETEFYKHFTLSTIFRCIRKEGSITTQIESFDQLPLDQKGTFDKVCKLACTATVNQRQVFTRYDVKSIFPDAGAKHRGSRLGLLATDVYFMRYGRGETYTFLHLTFQEYLAAIYLCGNADQIFKILQKCGINNTHLSVMWRFYHEMTDFKDEKTIDTFKNLLKEYGTTLSLYFCCESQKPSVCSFVIKAFNGELTFQSVCLTSSTFDAIAYTINNCDTSCLPSGVHLVFIGCTSDFKDTLHFLHKIDKHPLSIRFRDKYTNGGVTTVDHFLECLKRKCSIVCLRHLNLSNNGITDDGAEVIGEWLKHCTGLSTLNLESNDIGVKGAEALGRGLMISQCKANLKELKLKSNKIRYTGALALMRSVKNSTSLKELNLQDNMVNSDKIDIFIEEDSKIKRLIDDGILLL